MPLQTRCPACGYDLRSLISGATVTCPECGGTFRPVEAIFVNKRKLRGTAAPSWYLLCMLATPAIVLAVAMAAEMPKWNTKWPSAGAAFFGFAAGFAWALVIERRTQVRSSLAGGTPTERARAWGNAIVTAAMITAALGIPAVALVRASL